MYRGGMMKNRERERESEKEKERTRKLRESLSTLQDKNNRMVERLRERDREIQELSTELRERDRDRDTERAYREKIELKYNKLDAKFKDLLLRQVKQTNKQNTHTLRYTY